MAQDLNLGHQDNFDSHPESDFENGAAYIPADIVRNVSDEGYSIPLSIVNKTQPETKISEHTVTVHITIPIDDLVAAIEIEVKKRIQQAIREQAGKIAY